MNYAALSLAGGSDAAPPVVGWDSDHFLELQPHGAVLIIDAAGVITHAGDRAADVIGREPAQLVGTPVAQVVGDAEAERACALARGDRHVLGGWRPGALGDGSRVRVHTWVAGQERVGIDIVPGIVDVDPDIDLAIERVAGWNEWLSRSTSSVELLEIVARIARERLGFHGAWVVRLDAGDLGEIVAWDAPACADDLSTLVDASDLPPATPRVDGRAEAYFVDDLDRPGQRLWPADRGIDLQRSALLRPFPEYLSAKAGAGVRSTACLPLVGEHGLWGRVICHSHEQRAIPSPVQAELRLLATTASTRLTELLGAEDAVTAAKLARHTVRLIGGIAVAEDIATALAADPHPLLGICDADGAVLSVGGERTSIGPALDPQVVSTLLAVARRDLLSSGQPVVGRASVPDEAGIDPGVIGGYAAVRLDPEAVDVIVWLRREASSGGVDTLTEADALETMPAAGLPRTKHTTRPWMAAELAQILELRQAIVELQSARAAQLRLMNVELQRANDEYDAFTHAAAHDLRAPLRAIRQHAEFLAEDLHDRMTPDEAAELARIVRLSSHMRDMLDGLMAYARVGNAALVPEPVPVDEAVRDAVAYLGLELPAGAITATAQRFRADPKGLLQLLQNLIGNAVKHGSGTGRIEIDVTTLGAVRALAPVPETVLGEPDSRPVLTVSDDGPGIAPAHHERIFGLFRQLDPASSGSGAGLAICRLICRRHGGEIWVRSAPGHGCTFFVTVAGRRG